MVYGSVYESDPVFASSCQTSYLQPSIRRLHGPVADERNDALANPHRRETSTN